MVGAQAAGSSVLLVGELGPRLEGELAMHGVACARAHNANDAVARMKTTRFPFVVVPPVLVDMGGVDFIHGVLRHFDASVVLYGNGVESSEINALLRTGRVAHFPATVDGTAVADFLARRAGASTPTGTPRPASPPPLAGPIPGAGPLGGNGPGPKPFNLTPGPPPPPPSTDAGFPSSPGTNPGLSAALFSPSSFPPPGSFSSPGFGSASSPGFGSLSPSFPPAPTPLSSAATTFPPSGGFNFPSSPPYGEPPSPPIPSSLPVQSARPDARIEAMADDLARTNSELVTMRNMLAAAEQEKAALLVEVEAARRSAMQQVAQVMALSDEGDPIADEIAELKQNISDLERANAVAKTEADNLREARDRLVADAAAAAGKLAEAQARVLALEAQLADARGDLEGKTGEVEFARGEVDKLRLDLERAKGEALAARGEVERAGAAAKKAQDDALTMRGELERARVELERAHGDLEQLKANVDKARADVDKARADLDAAKAERAGQISAIMEQVEAARGERDLARGDADSLRTEIGHLKDLHDQVRSALESEKSQRGLLQHAIDELRATLGNEQQAHADSEEVWRERLQSVQQELEAAQARAGSADVEAALRIEVEKLRADVSSARTDATTVRLDLQEALMRLDEAGTSLQSITLERDTLRGEAGPLREWANQIVAEHARQQGELERLRGLLEGSAGERKRIDELQAEIEKLRRSSSSGSGGGGGGSAGEGNADFQAFQNRARQLAALVKALEPFTWGLQQATAFYARTGVGGSEGHLKLLQQLQGVLLRLRDEIAMLDLG